MPALRFGRAETVLGPMWLAETDAGVAASSRSLALDEFLAGVRRRFPGWAVEPDSIDGRWVERLTSDGWLPAVDLRGIPAFDTAVYEAVRSIRAGETMTYGDVARAVGRPGAARAVGGAMGRCPLFPAAPCHRVVRASDGWSGWGGDPALKRRLVLSEREASNR
jgi:O-6-methylguanine DNA methyltransferase